jgi:hypothetical protein
VAEFGFGLLDYLFWFPIIILIILGIISTNKNNEGSIFLLLIFYLIVTMPIIYYFNLPNGNYKARYIEIKKMKIGDGTEQSKEFDVTVTMDTITLEESIYYKEIYKLADKKNWYDNLYIKKFNQINGERFLTITRFGYVSVHNKDGEIYTKIRIKY